MLNLIFVFLLFILNSYVKNQIKVISPPYLKSKILAIDAGFSNFGNFPIGSKIRGKLYYNKNFDGCNSTEPDFFIKSKLGDSAIILIQR
jgi:hypothetical protein